MRTRLPGARPGRGDAPGRARPRVVLPRGGRRPGRRLGPPRRDAVGARRLAQRAGARPARAARARHRSRSGHGPRRQVVRGRRDDRPRPPVPRQHADGGGLHEPRSAAHDGHLPLHAAARRWRAAGSTASTAGSPPAGWSRSARTTTPTAPISPRYVARDRKAARLGEVALVDATSRIGLTGRTYGITLLDENAASHIAFGSGYSPRATRTARASTTRRSTST